MINEWSNSWNDKVSEAVERFIKGIQEAYNQKGKWTENDKRYIRKRIPYLEKAMYARILLITIHEALRNGN